MIKDDIIRMAREAGFKQLGPDIEDWVCFTDELVRFAELLEAKVRADERKLLEQALEALELHAKQYPHMQKGYTVDAITALRERLAKPDPRNQCGETCERAKLCAVCLAEMGAQPDPLQRLTDVQQALEALEFFADTAICSADTKMAEEGIAALRAALAEQEPVAQMREMLEVQGRDGTWNCDTYSLGMYNGMEFMVALAEGREPVFREPPERWLHTPQQREWQGLTDEESNRLVMEHLGPHALTGGKMSVYDAFLLAIRATEAKLKEKND